MITYVLQTMRRSPGRLILSIGGVALAIALMLSLDAILAGTEQQITAYIDQSDADIWVAQAGVRTMHMSASALPLAQAESIRAVEGVAYVTPILYVSSIIVLGQQRAGSYVIGLPADAESGIPQRAASSPLPPPGGAVIDQGLAQSSGLGLGDDVEILGRTFEVTGLSRGTSSLLTSVSVISFADFAALRGGSQTANYFLVRTTSGSDPSAVVDRIEAEVPGVTAQTRKQFATQERRLVRDMSTDLVAIMNTGGVLIGLAVMALTAYTAVRSRRQEYGVLKALGAKGRDLYGAVVAQAMLSLGIGLVFGLAFTALVAMLAPSLGTNLTLVITAAAMLRAAAVSLLIVALAVILPILQMANLDPAVVFRRAA